MGAFLEKPVTEKHSGDDENETLKCGYSSMQGWRIHQEDAYNCILNFDKDTSLFAVYDGHGGCEVAEYCSLNLPDFLKKNELYQSGDVERALVEGFLEFDRTLCTPDVIKELKQLVNPPYDGEGDDDDADDSEVEENVDNLYEEATMPIEEVIEKYKRSKKEEGGGGEATKGPEVGSSSSSCEPSCSSSEAACSSVTRSSKERALLEMEGNEAEGVSSSSGETAPLNDADKAASNGVESATPSLPDSSNSQEAVAKIPESEATDNVTGSTQNGVEDVEKEDGCSTTQEGDPVTDHKGKSKAVLKVEKIIESKMKRPLRNIRTPEELYKNLLAFAEESSEDDDSEAEDETFEGPNGNEASSDENEEPTNAHIKEPESDDESGEEEEAGIDEENADEEEDAEADEPEFDFGLKEPGYNSGSTAVLALLKGKELYVANVGDSRCLVCREGVAVEMSEDHKPEDRIEYDRITKAGGRVHEERINGGLNLSRAFGDFSYKQNKELSDKEQMVIALPDIRKLTIQPETDEFMVLACDGIWNCKSNQEVIDILRPKVLACDDNEKLSLIAEELLDQCLGTSRYLHEGNDNMTLIIVKFKKPSSKRSSSPPLNSPKRIKTEECTTTAS